MFVQDLKTLGDKADSSTPSELKPILVTGSPRSGTTWVGRMLALSPELKYVHEPFNPEWGADSGLVNLNLERFFFYICKDNESIYYDAVQRMFDGRYDLRKELLSARSVRDVTRSLRNWQAFSKHRKSGGVPLIKDPIAIMSAGWMADNFDIRCVVLARHPLAFVASMKRLNWVSHPEKWALSQDFLVRDVFKPFEDYLKQLKKGEHDLIERASLAWKLHHYVIARYIQRYPNWIFLRHEDISQDPVNWFEGLYKSLGLSFTPGVRQEICEHSSASNPSRAEGKEKPIKLNSKATTSSWKNILAPEEVQRIKIYVEDVANEFYSEKSWE